MWRATIMARTKHVVQPRHHVSRIYQSGESLGSASHERDLLLIRSIENQSTSTRPSNSWATSRSPYLPF